MYKYLSKIFVTFKIFSNGYLNNLRIGEQDDLKWKRFAEVYALHDEFESYSNDEQ